MTIGLRLRQGTQTMDLNSGRYGVTPNFVPPETKFTSQVTRGTALNKRGGRLVSRRPENREWKITLNVLAENHAEVDAAADEVQGWLDDAGETSNPVWIEWRVDDSVPEPMWGQFNTWRSYEIVQGGVTLIQSGEFNYTQLSGIVLTIEIKPYALGRDQRLCSAMGGVRIDRLGMSRRLARGTHIPEATTNLFFNPIFGGGSFGTGWTSGANLSAVVNTDRRFVAYGSRSARLTGLQATANTYTQQLTLAATTHTIWAIVKRPDGAAVTSSDMQIHYNGVDLTTTFTAIGDGFYVAEGRATGTAAADDCGVTVKAGRTIYLGAMQAEAKAYRTPLCHGDLMGCAWSSAAHNSSSTRTAGRVRISTAVDTVRTGPFSVRLVWKSGPAIANDMTLFDLRDGSHIAAMRLYITGTAFQIIYNGYTFSHATAIAVNTTYVLHATFDGATFELYVNGVASGNASTPTTLAEPGTYLYIGTDYSAANQANGVFGGLGLFDVALTATQVGAEYAAMLPLITAGQRIETIPVWWTKDGDDGVDNCSQAAYSTEAAKNNWGVCDGIPGTAEAKTKFVVNVGSAFDTDKVLWLSRIATDDFVAPMQQDVNVNPAVFADFSGTVTAVTDAGGQVSTTSVNTSVAGPTFGVFNDAPLIGKEIVMLARLSDAGANLQMAVRLIAPGTGVTLTSAFKAVQADATRRLCVSEPLHIPDQIGLSSESAFIKNFLIGPAFKRSVAGAANVSLDWVMFMPTPMAKIVKLMTGIGDQSIFIEDRQALIFNPATNDFYDVGYYTGDIIDLKPDKSNLLLSLLGQSDAANTIARTMTYTSIVVTPRWELV